MKVAARIGCCGLILATGPAAGADVAELVRGWSTMRAMDCARCHGANYEGSSGPSLLAAARDGSRARFDRFVLDGDVGRGMPGYRSQPAVADNLDAIYAYLVARARGEIGTGRPGGANEAPPAPPGPAL